MIEGGLLSAGEVRRLLQEIKLTPSKKRGQNFVIDAGTVRRIAELANLTPGQTVLEVGPGLGSLTLALLQRGVQVCAVEIDPRLANILPEVVSRKFSAEFAAANLKVINQDMLHTFELPQAPQALAANLPYNVAVPIIMQTLAAFPSIRSAVIMVQCEVAQRLAAPPGSRIYGAPSVKAAWWGQWQLAWRIGGKVFWPVPNVDSAVLRFTRRDRPEAALAGSVFQLIDTAFLQRRKMLRQSLKGLVGSEQFDAAGLSPTQRPEELSVDDFLRLAKACRADQSTPAAPKTCCNQRKMEEL